MRQEVADKLSGFSGTNSSSVVVMEILGCRIVVVLADNKKERVVPMDPKQQQIKSQCMRKREEFLFTAPSAVASDTLEISPLSIACDLSDER
jgi:hypothetical protein